MWLDFPKMQLLPGHRFPPWLLGASTVAGGGGGERAGMRTPEFQPLGSNRGTPHCPGSRTRPSPATGRRADGGSSSRQAHLLGRSGPTLLQRPVWSSPAEVRTGCVSTAPARTEKRDTRPLAFPAPHHACPKLFSPSSLPRHQRSRWLLMSDVQSPRCPQLFLSRLQNSGHSCSSAEGRWGLIITGLASPT